MCWVSSTYKAWCVALYILFHSISIIILKLVTRIYKRKLRGRDKSSTQSHTISETIGLKIQTSGFRAKVSPITAFCCDIVWWGWQEPLPDLGLWGRPYFGEQGPHIWMSWGQCQALACSRLLFHLFCSSTQSLGFQQRGSGQVLTRGSPYVQNGENSWTHVSLDVPVWMSGVCQDNLLWIDLKRTSFSRGFSHGELFKIFRWSGWLGQHPFRGSWRRNSSKTSFLLKVCGES